MPDGGDARAVLITGVYGTGKTSVVDEIADILGDRGASYAALDLDWLAWFHTGTEDESAEHDMRLTNLSAVMSNYLTAGVRFFVLALALRDQSDLDDLKANYRCPSRSSG